MLKETVEDNLVIVAPEGAWDAACSPAIRKRLEHHADEGLVRFVVDLTSVDYLDSSALSCLVALYKKVKGHQDARICLVGLNADLLDVFKETRLDRVFPIVPGIPEALEKVRGADPINP